MNIKFNKALMNSGSDYPLTQTITLHHPTVGEMLSIDPLNSESIYWKYIQLLMCDPYSNMVMLDDMGMDFMKTTPFEVFLLQWKQYEEAYEKNRQTYDLYGFKPIDMLLRALDFFIVEKHDFVYGEYDNGDACIYDKKNAKCQINREIFEYIYEWLKAVHKIDDSGRIRPADENARRILIEDTRAEIKKAKRRKKKADDTEPDYIGSLISAVCFGGNGAITPFNIKDCKMFWLFEAYSIDNKKSHANHILDSLYHGVMSKKDINMKEIDWTK